MEKRKSALSLKNKHDFEKEEEEEMLSASPTDEQ